MDNMYLLLSNYYADEFERHHKVDLKHYIPLIFCIIYLHLAVPGKEARW